MAERRVLIVGAGIVGVQCAIALRRRGFAVTVVDERGPGEGTSFGNAGSIALTGVTPIAMPGLIWQVPRMLLDPLGPLSIRWSYLPQLAPWLWQFLRAGSRARVEQITASLATLINRVWTDWDDVIAQAGIGDLFTRRGTLYVYETDKGFTDAAYGWELRFRHGLRARRLDARQIMELEPALAPIFRHGYLAEDPGHVADPYKVVLRLAAHLQRIGGEIKRGRVVGFEGTAPKTVVLADGGRLEGDALVIAAGAWSKPLCKMLGLDVPLDTERGYNTTLPDPGVMPSRPISPAESHFYITPMEIGLRIGGAVEFAGLDAPPNFARSKALLKLGQRVLPGLRTEGGREWMGFRPSMPDSMPVISVSPREPSVFLAFGHGHLGLTGSATTGRLIGELVAGDRTSIDVTPFSVARFRQSA
jgi:glycine/D-amino acid oxidase-like deaminating enzyme